MGLTSSYQSVISIGSNLPENAILICTDAAIPPNFYECDGNNGTPDLRGRSVVGYGVDSGYLLGDYLDILTDHSHDVSHTHDLFVDTASSNTSITSGLGGGLNACAPNLHSHADNTEASDSSSPTMAEAGAFLVNYLGVKFVKAKSARAPVPLLMPGSIIMSDSDIVPPGWENITTNFYKKYLLGKDPSDSFAMNEAVGQEIHTHNAPHTHSGSSHTSNVAYDPTVCLDTDGSANAHPNHTHNVSISVDNPGADNISSEVNNKISYVTLSFLRKL